MQAPSTVSIVLYFNIYTFTFILFLCSNDEVTSFALVCRALLLGYKLKNMD